MPKFGRKLSTIKTMATKMTQNGASTCIVRGEEKSCFFRATNGKAYVQYDYRDLDGELFSTVQKTLPQCREARDKWLNAKHAKKNECWLCRMVLVRRRLGRQNVRHGNGN